jgi:GMP synthase (glutamine-hydrolysing)
VRILSIVHEDDAGPGVFGDAVADRGDELEQWAPRREPAPDLARYDAVMVFGGAMHVDHEDRHPWLRAEKDLLRELVGRRLPVLGVCLGAQLLAEAAGAEPHAAAGPEIGWYEIELTGQGEDDPVLGPLAPRFTGFQWHSYEFPLPPGATALARTPACLQAFRLDGATWAIQFHAEVTRESIESWLADYASAEEAARAGVDPERLLADTDRLVPAWNDAGRGLCRRFLEEAERRPPEGSGRPASVPRRDRTSA